MSPKSIAAALGLVFALGASAADPVIDDGSKRPSSRQLKPAAQAFAYEARGVFQALLGDFALQRGELSLASDAWTDLALRTRDPAVIARAVQVAGHTRQYERALELARLWAEVEPGNPRASQAEASLLILANRLDDLAPRLQQLLAQDPASVGDNLLHLNNMLARVSDRKAAQRLVDRLAAGYEQLPEAHFAMAQAAASAGDSGRAQSEFDAALRLRPEWEAAALAHAQLQLRQSPDQAITGLAAFVERQPAARQARLTLARLLIGEKRYGEARRHFTQLLKSHPNDPDAIYPAAMLALQQGDRETARSQLERLLSTDFPDKSSIHFFLGQIEQENGKTGAALEHYRQVTGGDQFVPARARAAQILAEQGQLEAGRQLLHEARGRAESSQMALAEAQLLRDAGRHNDAYIVLDSALSTQPDHADLLYEAALVAEKLGKPELLESHLQHLLKLQPEHAHALNALGYSWADRNIRLEEAQTLIAQALTQAPQDPYIMDSMGWVLYRQGKLAEAGQILQDAYRLKSDPEIAAHLAEVLWQSGRRDEARRLLKDAAREFPGNSLLGSTLQKLQP